MGNTPGGEGDLQKVNPDARMQRERLESLRNYKFNQLADNESGDQVIERDFDFLLGFCPETVQEKVQQYRNQSGFHHLVSSALARVEELAGQSRFSGNVIEMQRTAEDEYGPDFSQAEFYRILLEKFREFSKIYGFDE